MKPCVFYSGIRSGDSHSQNPKVLRMSLLTIRDWNGVDIKWPSYINFAQSKELSPLKMRVSVPCSEYLSVNEIILDLIIGQVFNEGLQSEHI